MFILILCVVLAVLSVVLIVWSVRTKKSNFIRNLGIFALIVIMGVFGLYLSFSNVTKSIVLSDIKEEYIVTEKGVANIEGKYENVEDYQSIYIEVVENGKSLTDETAKVTIKPIENSFQIVYTMDHKKSRSKINIIFKADGKKVNKEVVVEKEEALVESSSEIVENSMSSEEVTEGQLTPTETTEEKKSKNEDEEKNFEVFNSIKGDTISRFNSNKESSYGVELKGIELSSDKEYIEVFTNKKIRTIEKEKQEEVVEDIGKKIIGLYRGSVVVGNDTEDIPIKIYTEDSKNVYAESKKDNAIELEIK